MESKIAFLKDLSKHVDKYDSEKSKSYLAGIINGKVAFSDTYILTEAIKWGKSSTRIELWYLIGLDWWSKKSLEPDKKIDPMYDLYLVPIGTALFQISRSMFITNYKSYENAKAGIKTLISKAENDFKIEPGKDKEIGGKEAS